MKVLLDTCILAELHNPKGRQSVKEAVMKIDDDGLFVSVLTVGEIAKGIDLLASGKKKKNLANG